MTFRRGDNGGAGAMRVRAFAAALLLVVGSAVVRDVEASTKYTLLDKNPIEVFESNMTCKNGNSAMVTTLVRGRLYALSSTSTNFTDYNWTSRMAELDIEPDDGPGLLLASVFGGPIEAWNLVPLHRSVNKEINAQSSLLNRWDEFEKWARKKLGKKYGAPVMFAIKIKYATQNGCRPIGFQIYAFGRAWRDFRVRFSNGPVTTVSTSPADR